MSFFHSVFSCNTLVNDYIIRVTCVNLVQWLTDSYRIWHCLNYNLKLVVRWVWCEALSVWLAILPAL